MSSRSWVGFVCCLLIVLWPVTWDLLLTLTSSWMVRQLGPPSLKAAYFVKWSNSSLITGGFLLFLISGHWRSIVELPLTETQWSFLVSTGARFQKLTSLWKPEFLTLLSYGRCFRSEWARDAGIRSPGFWLCLRVLHVWCWQQSYLPVRAWFPIGQKAVIMM